MTNHRSCKPSKCPFLPKTTSSTIKWPLTLQQIARKRQRSSRCRPRSATVPKAPSEMMFCGLLIYSMRFTRFCSAESLIGCILLPEKDEVALASRSKPRTSCSQSSKGHSPGSSKNTTDRRSSTPSGPSPSPNNQYLMKLRGSLRFKAVLAIWICPTARASGCEWDKTSRWLS
jgi:hypothetical protein